MTIVTSTIISQTPQADGRIAVREQFVDQLGNIFDRFYLALPTDNLSAILASNAIDLAAQQAASEIANNINQIFTNGSLAVTTFNYSTQAANFAALRAAFLTATRQDAIMVGDFFNSLTSAQLQAAFSISAAQVTTLKTNKLTPAATLAASIRANVGA